MKNKKLWAWILFVLGFLGVIIPHIAFLSKLMSNLNSIPHAVLVIISAVVMFIGYLLKR